MQPRQVGPQQQQQHQQMMSNMNRTLSNNGDGARLTPDGLSQLPHPSGRGLAKSMSPATVSYSVSHQPHPSSKFNMPNNGGPIYGQISQACLNVVGNVGAMKTTQPAMPSNAAMVRSRIPVPQGASSQSFQQNFPHLSVNPSRNPSQPMGSGNMTTSGSNMWVSQHLREMAEKQRTPSGE